MSKVYNGSFVVISDFHSYSWPIEKIEKHYLNEYEHIYILGDCTDRGPDGEGLKGIDLLLKIKSLMTEYSGRIHYVPGNHDDFIYKYMTALINGSDTSYLSELIEHNGGYYTVEQLNDMFNNNRGKFNELYNWLGTLPIQVKHEYNGKKYCLAHALFDDVIYKNNPNANLRDLNNCSKKDYNNYFNILWFRKYGEEYECDPSRLPSSNEIMVIGHTPKCYRNGANLDLINNNKETIHVVCVDEGIAYNGGMTMGKYDGHGRHSIPTQRVIHHNTSDTSHGDDSDYVDEDDSILFDDNDNTREDNSSSKIIHHNTLGDNIKYVLFGATGVIFDKVDDLVYFLKNADYSVLIDVLYTIGDYFKIGIDNIIDKVKYSSKKKGIIIGLIIALSVGGFLGVKTFIGDDTTITTTASDETDDDYVYYTVESGDSLGVIASKYNTTVDVILYLNEDISDPDSIYVGERIRLVPGITNTNELSSGLQL